MNVKVVLIFVGVVVVSLLGAPIAIGLAKGTIKPGAAPAQAASNAEWTPANIVGTSWGGVHTEVVPEMIGTGSVTVDLTITFRSGGTFGITPIITVSDDAPAMVKNMTKGIADQIKDGKWTLNYPKLTLTMVGPKGEEQSVDATISGSTITGPNILKPGAPPLVLTRK